MITFEQYCDHNQNRKSFWVVDGDKVKEVKHFGVFYANGYVRGMDIYLYRQDRKYSNEDVFATKAEAIVEAKRRLIDKLANLNKEEEE